MKATVETLVAAPPEIVYATAIDIPGWPDFITGIERIELLDESPIGVGTRFRETRTMFGRSATEEMTVAALEPPHRFVLTAENHGTRYVATHDIVAAPGGSRLTLTFEGVPVTVAAKLLSVIGMLFMGAVKRKLQEDLAQLKQEAEQRARGERRAVPAGAPREAG